MPFCRKEQKTERKVWVSSQNGRALMGKGGGLCCICPWRNFSHGGISARRNQVRLILENRWLDGWGVPLGCRRPRSRPCYDPGGLWCLASQLASWGTARLDSMSFLGSLGTNLRAAHRFGAGDVHFTALTVSFWEFVQVEKWWHPVLWQMLLVLKGVSFYVRKIKMASESFPRPCSEKYFASLIFFHNKNQSQNQIKITAVGWIWIWMLSSEPVVQEDLELRFLTWLDGRMKLSGPAVTVLTCTRVSLSRPTGKTKIKPLLLAEWGLVQFMLSAPWLVTAIWIPQSWTLSI